MYLEVKNMKKSYGKDGSYIQVLKGITTGVEQGEMCVIQGTSGSGKSTFLNCIGGLDTLDSGSIKVDGKEIAGLKQEALSDYRRDNLGFIFQFYNLVPNLTVRENIQVCEYLAKNPLNMEELLEILGLTEHQNKFPSQLSGGQQQRCAIARALIKNPKLLLLDEPTGALDSKTSQDILILLEEINQKYGTTMLLVTHNNSIKNMVHKVIIIKDGQIHKEYKNEIEESPMKTLLFLGDSITDCGHSFDPENLGNGYVRIIAENFSVQKDDVKILNKGIDGFTNYTHNIILFIIKTHRFSYHH